MKVKDILTEFYEPGKDKSVMRDFDDTRRPRLTISDLHSMRVAKDSRRISQKERLDILPMIYGSTEEEF